MSLVFYNSAQMIRDDFICVSENNISVRLLLNVAVCIHNFRMYTAALLVKLVIVSYSCRNRSIAVLTNISMYASSHTP